ncbi:hypothetical protein CCACVL1_27311 [Corchorus capsularis]|uniref:Uncharacterized protein n=1 Tax=Corchorus capsularis TaxID=210143 RepID=A0A1R3GB82_COCAP|nr:hypothetical protein CCACVL1_27311 [Corchorus capsularis]
MAESSLSRCSPFTSSISSTSITSTPTRRASLASKANLYLVFEHLDIDLMKFIDSHPKGPNPRPLSPSHIQSFFSSFTKRCPLP